MEWKQDDGDTSPRKHAVDLRKHAGGLVAVAAAAVALTVRCVRSKNQGRHVQRRIFFVGAWAGHGMNRLHSPPVFLESTKPPPSCMSSPVWFVRDVHVEPNAGTSWRAWDCVAGRDIRQRRVWARLRR